MRRMMLPRRILKVREDFEHKDDFRDKDFSQKISNFDPGNSETTTLNGFEIGGKSARRPFDWT